MPPVQTQPSPMPLNALQCVTKGGGDSYVHLSACSSGLVEFYGVCTTSKLVQHFESLLIPTSCARAGESYQCCNGQCIPAGFANDAQEYYGVTALRHPYSYYTVGYYRYHGYGDLNRHVSHDRDPITRKVSLANGTSMDYTGLEAFEIASYGMCEKKYGTVLCQSSRSYPPLPTDCGDNSDENGEGTACGEALATAADVSNYTRFGCPFTGRNMTVRCCNLRCVPDRKIADGVDDCGDNSDEDGSFVGCALDPALQRWKAGCDGFTCESSGACIHQKWRCDGEQDCGDGDISDEQDCDSQPTSTCAAAVDTAVDTARSVCAMHSATTTNATTTATSVAPAVSSNATNATVVTPRNASTATVNMTPSTEVNATVNATGPSVDTPATSAAADTSDCDSSSLVLYVKDLESGSLRPTTLLGAQVLRTAHSDGWGRQRYTSGVIIGKLHILSSLQAFKGRHS